MNEASSRTTDLIILGGGCAGLSLAARLALATPTLRVAIIEPRTNYDEDRTWCGWRVQPHLFEDCAVQQWLQWRIVDGQDVVERGSRHFPYEMVRSDLFYAKARKLLQSSSNVCLRGGLSAVSLEESRSMVQVRLSDGSPLEAPWVIDTRPPAPKIQPPWLWQNFVGLVVRGDFSGSGLENIPILMDFQPAGDSIARFMYVLPIAPGLALCEWTQFAAIPGQQMEIESRLTDWIARNVRSEWSLERRESGSLPMALVSCPNSRRVIAAGTRGGSMRASSGYAFHAIQRWADACTHSLQHHGIPLPPARTPLLGWMDRVFMQVLQQPGRSAADLFTAMFRDTPPDSLVRFLAGVPQTKDLWPVMRSLPWVPFLQAVPRALSTRSAP